MEKVKNSLREDIPVELCMEKDVICSACPNLEKGVCATAEKVKNMTQWCCRPVDFPRVHRFPGRRFFQAVGKNIIRAGRRQRHLRGLQLDRNLYQKRKRRAVKKNSFMKYQILVGVHEAVLFIPILCRSPDRYRSRHRSFQAASGSFHRGSFLPHQEK